MEVTVRRARTADVRGIRRLVDMYVADRRLLSKATVTLYEDVQEFWVAERDDGEVVGCGALHVMWEDLAEVRTVAVDPAAAATRSATGSSRSCSTRPASSACGGCSCSPSRPRFFGSFGFAPIDGTPVPHGVYEQLLRSYDEGVAEFLDLERVKPNTLGNTRMLLHL